MIYALFRNVAVASQMSPQTAHVKIKCVFGTLTCGKNTEKPFGSLWIPGKGVCFFWAPGRPGRSGTDFPGLTKAIRHSQELPHEWRIQTLWTLNQSKSKHPGL